jgi:hypothetical protein
MDREALLAMLKSRYGDIATEAGMTLDDEETGLKPVLDRVQGWLDVDLAPALEWHEPLARYAALDYLADRLSVQMNVSRDGKSYQLNQLFTNVRALLADAKAAVAWFVDPIAPGTSTSDIPVATPWTVIVPGPTW